MISLIALCLTSGFYEALTGIYSGDGALYATSGRQVFSIVGSKHKIVGELRPEERFIGTDIFSRPLVDDPGFRQLVKPKSGVWDVGKDDRTWDFTRFILGIRSGVLVSFRESVTAMDFQPDADALGKLSRLSFKSELTPMMNPSVSPARDACAIALRGNGTYAIAVTDLNSGTTAFYEKPNVGGPLLQVECVKKNVLIVLAGNEPSLSVDTPTYGKTSFRGDVFIYHLTDGSLRKVHSLTLRWRESYLARSSNAAFVILAASELVAIDIGS